VIARCAVSGRRAASPKVQNASADKVSVVLDAHRDFGSLRRVNVRASWRPSAAKCCPDLHCAVSQTVSACQPLRIFPKRNGSDPTGVSRARMTGGPLAHITRSGNCVPLRPLKNQSALITETV